MKKIGTILIVMFLQIALFSSYINHAKNRQDTESNNKSQKLYDMNSTEEPIQKNKDSNVLVLD